GADDYVTKPFSARILTARVKAVLRRSAVEPEDEKETLTQGPFEIDRLHHTVRVDGQPLELTLSEFKALELFAKRPGVVFSRYQIVDAIHGKDYPVTDRSVDVLIVGLRRKLGDYGEWIETVRGVGYRMKAE
ncbi:MAG TPA: response regulator transcription factor, partial [Lentisphaerae bacterium]|nr:response regulator transcription factor [Lentisphaerota bacterium]